MARRNRETPDLERDDDIIASLSAPVPSPAPLLTPGYLPNTPNHEALFNEIEDRRTYHPEGLFRPALTTVGGKSSYNNKHPAKLRFPTTPVFETPPNRVGVLVCVRRKQRREVIFAKKKHRRGAGARRRRRNYYSNVRC